MTNHLKIITDCILGLAVGDALGVPYEFMRRDQVEAAADLRHMKASSSFHEQPPGAWSDDTAMCLASMDSLTRCRGFDAEDTMAAFLDWYRNAAYSSTGVAFGVGGTVSRALSSALHGVPALSCGRRGFRDNGNGALMRIAPISLWCAFRELPRDEEVQLVSDAGAVTHAHEISKLGCLIYTDYLKELIRGASKEQAYSFICRERYSLRFTFSTVAVYDRILNGRLPELPRYKLAESGYVVNTLEAALWATLRTASYEEAVGESIRLGYDTDTLAALTGSLCGVLYGSESIPEAWRDELLKRSYLESLCAEYAKLFS